MNSNETANTFLRVLLHIIFKRKYQIITFFIATFLTVGIFTFGIKPTFKATSEILIKMGREHLFVPTRTDSGISAVASYSSIEQINSEIEVIKSRPIVEKVIDSIGPTALYEDLRDKTPGFFGVLREKLVRLLGDDDDGASKNLSSDHGRLSDHEAALLRFEKKLEVRGIDKSRIIEISFKHSDPRLSALVLQNLIDTYLELRPQIHKNPESYAFFEEQSEILKKRVRQIENKLKAFKEQNDIVALDQERTLLLQKKADLRAELNTSLITKIETENRIKQVSNQLNSTPAKIKQGETNNLNPFLINTLEERLVALQLKEKELLTKYTESNHLVVQVREELRIVQKKLAGQESKRYGTASFGPNPTYRLLKEKLYQNEAELEAVRGKIETQEIHLTDYIERLDKLNQVEYKLDELQNQLEVDQKNYQLYLTKYEENRISHEMDTKKLANVSVIKPAKMPIKPVSPKIPLNIALGLFLAVFGSIGMALGLEFLNDRLERPEDIENVLDIPVLASVSEYKHS